MTPWLALAAIPLAAIGLLAVKNVVVSGLVLALVIVGVFAILAATGHLDVLNLPLDDDLP